jgi:pimeloyl-ACP methyl ester carboxylesterase
VLLASAGYPEGLTLTPTQVTSGGTTAGHPAPLQDRWSNPEQERWVEEPVFNGRLHLVEAGQHNLQTIILIHGLGYRGILDWAQVFPRLADRYHVIAIDLPGFGSSDKQQVQYAPQNYARLVNWTVSQHAHGPVIVIGHSMGGAVGLRYAQNYPEQASRLIMVDTAGVLQRTVFIKHIARVPVTYEWSAPYQETIPMLDKLIQKVARKADNWTGSLLVIMDRMIDIPQLMMSSSLARQYLYKDRSSMNAALGLVYEDFSTAIREVDLPTHIIWGEHDNVAPIRTGTLLANLMPNAELHVIGRAGHVPMTDNFADFMAVLTHALEQSPRARQAQERLELIENQEMVQENTSCEGRIDLVYTGHHGVVRLLNCRGVVLRNLVAESIEMTGSEVSMENVKLDSPSIGMTVSNSVVSATLLQIDANAGMAVENSYLDLAGADFVTRNTLVDIRKDSRIYFSLSRYHQGGQIYNLHGVSLGPVFNLN